MAANYNKLWKLLIDKGMKKKDLQLAAGISSGVITKMGKGEEHMGGRNRESIIADAVEAVIAAIFLDGGFEEAKKFVLNTFSETIEDAISGRFMKDYKTELQEELQLEELELDEEELLLDEATRVLRFSLVAISVISVSM